MRIAAESSKMKTIRAERERGGKVGASVATGGGGGGGGGRAAEVVTGLPSSTMQMMRVKSKLLRWSREGQRMNMLPDTSTGTQHTHFFQQFQLQLTQLNNFALLFVCGQETGLNMMQNRRYCL